MILAGLSAHMSMRADIIPAFVGSNIYERSLEAMTAQIGPTISALALAVTFSHCHHRSQPFTPPAANTSFVANVFLMLGRPLDCSELVQMEKLWLLYADHGLANATAAFLHAASTRADPLSCLISALSSGYGPLHGGAIDMVYHMLLRVRHKRNVPALIDGVKRGREKLYGFGHRVYDTVDPRAALVKEVLEELKTEECWEMEIAEEIERCASEDEWFQSRDIRMNVDLFGSFVYTAL
ncbi:hypothetical protein ACLMJK_003863 [Lecanora helva]